MSGRALTVRGVKMMLSRDGVDHSQLSFERIDRSGVHTGGTYAGQYRERIDIRITGPEPDVGAAFVVLLARGLAIVPCDGGLDVYREP